MKKFSKLLVLLLTLVAVATVFSVTILASESTESTLLPPVDNVHTAGWADHEQQEVGVDFVNNTSSKAGKWTVKASENGNKFALWEYETPARGEENLDYSLYIGGANLTSTYNVWDYPYTVMDFDIMTTVGAYPAARFAGRYKSPDDFCGEFALADLSLSTVPYNWQHVTLIWETDIVLVDLGYEANFKLHAYVDGNFVGTFELADHSGAANLFKESEFKSFWCHQIRINPGRTTNADMALDNVKFTIFAEGYELSDIASHVYGEGYELPFGTAVATITDADGIVTYYDDINKAIAAAEKDEVIKLVSDVDGIVSVDKAVTIDTNKYGEDGNATGEFYAFQYTSGGFIPTVTEGKIAFANAGESKINVYWDLCLTCEACPSTHGGEGCTCSCESMVPSHIMYAQSDAVVGTTPIYPGQAPTFEMVDGVVTQFAGWSRTLGGKAEDIVVTNEDLAAGWIVLYPVYEVITYTFELTSATGAVSYHVASEFEELFAKAPVGATIKLIRDLDTDAGAISVNKKLTLDMNGFDIRRSDIYGTTYLFKAGDTTDEVISATEQKKDMFIVDSGFELTIKSDARGSEFYVASMKRDVWVDADGNVVKFTTGYTGATKGNGYTGKHVTSSPTKFVSNSSYSYSLTLENISVYTTCLIFQGWKSGITTNITINDCKVYRVYEDASTSDCLFYMGSNNGGKLIANDSFFYSSNSSYLMRFTTNAGNSLEAVFTNCDIYAKSDAINELKIAGKQKYVDCRYYNVNANTNAGVFSGESLIYPKNDSSYNMILAALPLGYAIAPTEVTYTYTVPKTTAMSVDENGFLTFAFEMVEEQVTYTYTVGEGVEVTWMHNGEAFATTIVPVGGVAVGPEITYQTEGDNYRTGKYLWVNAEGKADLAITDANTEYVFYSTEKVDGVGDYSAKITGAHLSLIYYAQFHVVFYLPVCEDMTSVPKVSGANSSPSDVSKVVYINGVAYWAYTYWSGTVDVFKDIKSTVTYTIDGETYTKDVAFSGIQYAELVLSNANYTNEYESVANMVRYVREALEVKGDASFAAKIEELIGTANADGSTTGGLYSLPAYVTEYENVESNVEALAPYISSLQYGLSGSTVNFIMNLTEKAKTDNIRITIKCNGVNPGIWTNNDANGNPQKWDSWSAHNVKVYDIIHPMTITVSVPATETEEAKTITATFSIGAYLAQNPDVEAVKALYAFGVSAAKYKG